MRGLAPHRGGDGRNSRRLVLESVHVRVASDDIAAHPAYTYTHGVNTMHAHGRREARAMQRSQRSPIAAGLLRIVRRAGCGVRRASCVVRR